MFSTRSKLTRVFEESQEKGGNPQLDTSRTPFIYLKKRTNESPSFSILDDEWKSHIKASLELWLSDGNFDGEGKQRKRLEDIRAEILGRIEGV